MRKSVRPSSDLLALRSFKRAHKRLHQASEVLQMVNKLSMVATSDASPPEERKAAYSKLADFYYDEGYHADAIVLHQLSVNLQPAKETFARAILNGVDSRQAAVSVIEGVDDEEPPKRHKPAAAELDDCDDLFSMVDFGL